MKRMLFTSLRALPFKMSPQCPVKDRMWVEKSNLNRPGCPVRDKMLVENIESPPRFAQSRRDEMWLEKKIFTLNRSPVGTKYYPALRPYGTLSDAAASVFYQHSVPNGTPDRTIFYSVTIKIHPDEESTGVEIKKIIHI